MAADNLSWAFYGIGVTKLSSVIPKEENLGRDISVFTYSHLIGLMCGAFIAGTIAEDSYSCVFLVKMAIMLAAALLVWYGIKIKE